MNKIHEFSFIAKETRLYITALANLKRPRHLGHVPSITPVDYTTNENHLLLIGLREHRVQTAKLCHRSHSLFQ